MTIEPDKPKSAKSPHRPTWRGAAFAAAYGAITASIAYSVSRGSLLWTIAIMVLIGVIFRLLAYLLIQRRGIERPPWWRWL